MRKLLFILLLLSGICAKAQNTLYIFLNDEDYTADMDGLEDAEDANIISDLFYGIGYNGYGEGEHSLNMIETSIQINHWLGYNDDPSNDCGGPCGIFSWRCTPDLVDYSGIINLFEEIQINDGDIACVPVSYKAVFLPDTELRNTTSCMEESLFESYDGIPHNVSSVTWYYYDDILTNDWVELPNYAHRYPLDVSIESIFGADYATYFSGNLQLKYEISASFTSDIYEELFLPVSIIPCSPELIQDPDIHVPSCSYSTDGGFTLYFDRSLEMGESLDFTLYQGTYEEGVLVGNQLGATLEPDRSYTWPAELAPGEYTFRYQSQPNGNVSEIVDFTITAPPPLAFNAVGTSINCFGQDNGRIEFAAGGGTGTYFYILNGGTPVEFTTPHTINDLPPGDYELQVIDENACIGNYDNPNETIFITITEPDAPLLVEGTVSDAMGFELATGGIDVTVSGGTAPYTYLWNTEATTEDIENIPAGTYEITVTDANDCQQIVEFTVNEPELLLITIEYSGSGCFEDVGGSIHASASGGYPSYRYELFREESPENFISTGDVLITEESFSVEELSPGSYRIALIDNGGTGIEVVSDMVTISEVSELIITNSSLSHALCSGEDTGSIDISVSGGTLPYSYRWNEGAYTTEDLSDVPPGVYSLVVSDANSCELPVQFFEIIGPETETAIEFLMASQAFTRESLIIVEVSYPLPDEVEWILPEGATVMEEDSEFIELVFETAGSYEIGMQALWGDCELIKTKTVVILEEMDFMEDGMASHSNRIESFTVYPNPSNGNFSIQVTLKKISSIHIKIFGLVSNALLADISAAGKLDYEIPITLAPLPPGLYAVVLETPFGSQVRKIIVE